MHKRPLQCVVAYTAGTPQGSPERPPRPDPNPNPPTASVTDHGLGIAISA
jgi:hypothetical protein